MKRGIIKAMLGGVYLVVLWGLILTSVRVLADDDSVVDEVNVTVSESCTLAGVGMNSHIASLQNAQYSGDVDTYESGIGKTTLTAFCNDFGGFAIYAVGYTGDSESGANHTKMVGVNTGATIDTGVYDGDDAVSSWAMKLTKVADDTVAYIPANMSVVGGFNNWHVIPDDYAKVAEYHASAGSSATDTVLGGKLETTYAIAVSTSQVADTYEGKVKYVLVHPYTEEPLQPQSSASGKICYYANASDAVGTMGCQNVSSSVTLLASNFSRTGYGFAGWSDAFDYKTNENAKFYGPQEKITLTPADYQSPNNGLSLYAVWAKSAGNLQDTTKVAELCGTGTNALATAPTNGTANLSSVSALTDQRDNQTYAIAKLADGNCWMIENLRLQNTGADNTNGSLAQGYGGQFAGLANPETAWANNIATANSLYSTDGADNTINISTSDASYRFPRYNNTNTPTNAADRPQNPTSNTFTNDSTTVGMYSYGNYYTWSAAIADTAAYASNNTSVTNTSICPTGWHLPKGGNKSNEANNEFWSLVVTGINNGTIPANYESSATPYYTGTAEAGPVADKLRSYPNNFVYSGYVDSGLVYGRGSYGYYWSSTANSSGSAYYLRLSSSNVYPGTSYIGKYVGRAVRCVASGV